MVVLGVDSATADAVVGVTADGHLVREARIEPGPVGEASRDGRLAFQLGHVPAGGSFVLYLDYQVNPTTVGRRRQVVDLSDGPQHLLTVRRTLTVFP